MLRTKDAARLLEISVRHLGSLVRSGRVPHVRFGRSIRFPLEMLRDYLNREAAKSVRRARTRSGES
ncbi:MAG: helix-turn-helix domain-containing protein [Planctomycetota bacterium]